MKKFEPSLLKKSCLFFPLKNGPERGKKPEGFAGKQIKPAVIEIVLNPAVRFSTAPQILPTMTDVILPSGTPCVPVQIRSSQNGSLSAPAQIYPI
jgi:hypothetical protein